MTPASDERAARERLTACVDAMGLSWGLWEAHHAKHPGPVGPKEREDRDFCARKYRESLDAYRLAVRTAMADELRARIAGMRRNEHESDCMSHYEMATVPPMRLACSCGANAHNAALDSVRAALDPEGT